MGRRWVEWGLLTVVVLVLLLLFLQEARRLQGQAERAAVQSTLGALRTAGILQDLRARATASAPSEAGLPVNPFDLLQSRPGNYLGALDSDEALTARAGSWYFDSACVCVVYLPLEPRWISSTSGSGSLRFRVRRVPGPLQLDPLERYLWQGRLVE